MTVPFMRAYTELLVQTCHRRGAHAIGGMSALIPSRRDPEANEIALAQVGEDKRREAGDGFDGTWIAHPDLVDGRARRVRGGARRCARTRRSGCARTSTSAASSCSTSAIPGSTISRAGVRANIDIGLRYLQSWLAGQGAAAIHGLMEDAATAEISRAQLWQWRHLGVALSDGGVMDDALYTQPARRARARARRGRAAGGRAARRARAVGDVRGVPDPAGLPAARLGSMRAFDLNTRRSPCP